MNKSFQQMIKQFIATYKKKKKNSHPYFAPYKNKLKKGHKTNCKI